jgi:D-alanyl-D-alanine carboxypeptidase
MHSKQRKFKKGVIVVFALAICVLVVVIITGMLKLRKQTQEGSSAMPVSSGLAGQSSSIVSSASSNSTSSTSASSGQIALGGLLMLVNKDNALPSSFTPNLVTVPSNYYYTTDKDTRFDSSAASYLEKFLTAGRTAGYKDLCVLSGYRTYAYQQSNYDRHVKSLEAKGETVSQAKIDAAKLVAPPGTSEHETGLAVDIISSTWYNKTKDLTSDFDTTAAFTWLYANCTKYGFILRYSKDKVSETGYEYEPWHYRFVGVENAKKIKDSGLCLEEYDVKLK